MTAVLPTTLAILALAALLPAAPGDARRRAAPLFRASVTLELGRDRGQNFGTLFETRDAEGRVVAGAGFAGVYNTRFRMDPRTLQFYVRPRQEGHVVFRRLPRPDNDCGLYMGDFDGRLLAINDVTGRFFHEWDPPREAWRRAGGEAARLTSSRDAVMRVGRDVLRFAGGQAEYAGRTILPAPAAGSYNHFYYAGGRIYFYHTVREEGGGGFTRIHSCPWSPEDPAVDLGRSETVTVAPPGSVSWAFGQLGDEVLTVTNYGGVYAHGPGGWRALREPSPGVSYQVYSMLSFGDRLLLGQYPTGEVFEYDGQSLKRREGFPPRLPEVSPRARECQTLALYRGELFAGVWPWGEVWRRDADSGEWHSMGRLFTHPAPTAAADHPYEAEAKSRGLVANDWGQRVTSMVPVGDSLMLSTSAKGNHRWDGSIDFLSGEERREYGAVHRLTLRGNLAVPIRWKEGPSRLEFQAFRNRLVVRQDGRTLGEARLEPPLAEGLGPVRTAWGSGVFGPLRGVLRDAAASPGDSGRPRARP